MTVRERDRVTLPNREVTRLALRARELKFRHSLGEDVLHDLEPGGVSSGAVTRVLGAGIVELYVLMQIRHVNTVEGGYLDVTVADFERLAGVTA